MGGTLKSSILIGFSIKNHSFWGTPILGNLHSSDDDAEWSRAEENYEHEDDDNADHGDDDRSCWSCWSP